MYPARVLGMGWGGGNLPEWDQHICSSNMALQSPLVVWSFYHGDGGEDRSDVTFDNAPIHQLQYVWILRTKLHFAVRQHYRYRQSLCGINGIRVISISIADDRLRDYDDSCRHLVWMLYINFPGCYFSVRICDKQAEGQHLPRPVCYRCEVGAYVTAPIRPDAITLTQIMYRIYGWSSWPVVLDITSVLHESQMPERETMICQYDLYGRAISLVENTHNFLFYQTRATQ